MELQEVLLPIDVARCPLGAFDLINRLGESRQLNVILLHVVTLNVLATENRIYEELCSEARVYLEKLASGYLARHVSTVLRVRRGDAAEEILAEARTDQPDTILLPVHRALPGKGSLLESCAGRKVTVSAVVKKLIQGASCGVLVVPFDTCFDCEKAWGRPAIPVGQDEKAEEAFESVLSPIFR